MGVVGRGGRKFSFFYFITGFYCRNFYIEYILFFKDFMFIYFKEKAETKTEAIGTDHIMDLLFKYIHLKYTSTRLGTVENTKSAPSSVLTLWGKHIYWNGIPILSLPFTNSYVQVSS